MISGVLTSLRLRDPRATQLQSECNLPLISSTTRHSRHDHAERRAFSDHSQVHLPTFPSIATMGICLSCLGLRSPSEDDPDRRRLLYDDYQPTATNYGTWGTHAIPPENMMSAEEVQREQEEFSRITQEASDHIIEIFPHNHPSMRNITSPPPQSNGQLEPMNGEGSQHETQGQSYQDILLSMIPGDKSKRSIRIYPSSRPNSSSRNAPSMRSKSSSSRLNESLREKAVGVFVKFDVDLP